MFFRRVSDDLLAQYGYLIGCQRTDEAIVIDPERDIDRYVELARSEGLEIVAVAETHIHADFLSGAREFAEQYGTKLFLSDEGGPDWGSEWARKGSYDVRFLHDGDRFRIGNVELRALHTPGHTPEHLSYFVTDLGSGSNEPMGIASGDFVFVGDVGRPDLLETAAGVIGAQDPSARTLYASVLRFLQLPDHLQVWPGHGAGSACGKALGAVPQSTVGYERRHSPALAHRSEEEFVDFILEGQPEPPLYFARMKELNREGPPVLGPLPTPQRIDTHTLGTVATSKSGFIVDTRGDRAAFFGRHIPGSLHAPLGKDLPMTVGSYADPDMDIYLIVDPRELEPATRSLVRIGYDRVVGWAPPAVLEAYELAHVLRSIDRLDLPDFDVSSAPSDATILDVRAASEFEEAHLPNAVNIAHTRLGERLSEVPTGHPVFVYCRTGNRASAAASLLAREGRDVTLLDGLLREHESCRVSSASAGSLEREGQREAVQG